jgi:thioesterase domain-containing protein
MLIAVAAFSGMDTLLKLLSQRYPPMEVVALRGASSIPFMLLPLIVMGRLSALKPVRIGMHMLRGVLMLLVLIAFVYAVRALSLADAYAIFLAAPLIVTALSVPLLGEHVGWRRWLAICVGLVGVITMLHPSASSLVSLGAVAALLSATGYAFNAIALRVITRTDTTASVVFWMISLMTVLALGLAAPHIPLSVAMGVQVKVATPLHVLLSAPLAPNINHHHTVFGGSGVVLATLAAWTLLHLRLENERLDAQLVIQRSSMEYERPIAGDFEAECRFADEPAWCRFRSTLERRGRARMTLTARLLHAAHEMGSFVGDFVALGKPGRRP